VYVGPFANRSSAKKRLAEVKKNIAIDAFITKVDSNLLHSNNKKDIVEQVTPKKEIPIVVAPKKEAPKEVTPKKETPKEVTPKKEAPKEVTPKKETPKEVTLNSATPTNYFVGISGGMGSVGIEQEGDMQLDINLDDSAIDYGVEIGYNLNEDFFITANYQYTSLEDFYLHNLYASLDYKLGTIIGFTPYIGIIGGFNMMQWENYPISSIDSIDPTYSFVAGAQIGGDIDINDNFALYLFYKYWMMDYQISIASSSASKEIKFTSEQNINFGLKYKF
jgi:opacity protein-like surface antigen